MNHTQSAVSFVLSAALPQLAAESDDMLQYRTALRAMDWQFEFSDDQRVVDRARDALHTLRQMQQKLDPKGEMWLAIAPKGLGIPGPWIVRAA